MPLKLALLRHIDNARCTCPMLDSRLPSNFTMRSDASWRDEVTACHVWHNDVDRYSNLDDQRMELLSKGSIETDDVMIAWNNKSIVSDIRTHRLPTATYQTYPWSNVLCTSQLFPCVQNLRRPAADWHQFGIFQLPFIAGWSCFRELQWSIRLIVPLSRPPL